MGKKASTLEDLGGLTGDVIPEFWKGKKVFLTGHTGFKGSWLSLWLQMMGANVKGFALEPPTSPSLFIEAKVGAGMISHIGDINDLEVLGKSMLEFDPEILIHMAAQPLVRLSYQQPIETFKTNVIGTANVLEAARSCKSLKAIISVTTDKCYKNNEWVWGYRENEPMGGDDPYSSSKACAEIVTEAYRKSFFNHINSPGLATARAGNVIGGGDWAPDRLIPDILFAFGKSEPVVIRNPSSIRPWQHVLEPLSGYLVLAQNLYEKSIDFSEAWNFGPREDDAKSVKWILENMCNKWGNGASWTQDQSSNPHEATCLKLDCSKASLRLNWKPKWSLDFTISNIINWHQSWILGKNMKDYCFQEIQNYQNS